MKVQADWNFEITDYQLAALRVIEDPEVREAVGVVIARRIKASKGRIDIPGVKITKVRRAAS